MGRAERPLAVVTGASSGIGLELARILAARGHDLIVAADRSLDDAMATLQSSDVRIVPVHVDLASEIGVDKLIETVRAEGRGVDVLCANAGHGLGHAFLDQDWRIARHVIDTNVTGTAMLAHALVNDMRKRGSGRVLFTGSIAGFMPGTFQAVYNATKAFVNSFSFALREELDGSGVTVTCLMPGATETKFFERADMLDTKVGTSAKDDPAEVARTGIDAMFRGDGDIVYGWKNKLQTTLANVTPSGWLAEQHRKQAEPGSAEQ